MEHGLNALGRNFDRVRVFMTWCCQRHRFGNRRSRYEEDRSGDRYRFLDVRRLSDGDAHGSEGSWSQRERERNRPS